jgi:hypothetical protein
MMGFKDKFQWFFFYIKFDTSMSSSSY